VAAAGGSQQIVVLNFPDHSVEVCPSTGFVYQSGTLNVDVLSCASDTIFSNGFDVPKTEVTPAQGA
jgi:hypothetical protein